MMPNASQGFAEHKSNGQPKMAQADRTLSHGEPAEPLLRVFPIKRWVPQDVHSVLDYAHAVTAASGFFTADDEFAAWTSIGLGAGLAAVSALTDYRLSVSKTIPIRVHEAHDYLWGAACIAAPFVFGYWKKSPATAITHMVVGVGSILGSLFTDYRSYKQQKAEQGDFAPALG